MEQRENLEIWQLNQTAISGGCVCKVIVRMTYDNYELVQLELAVQSSLQVLLHFFQKDKWNASTCRLMAECALSTPTLTTNINRHKRCGGDSSGQVSLIFQRPSKQYLEHQTKEDWIIP